MLNLPNDILNDTPADATPVEQNYTAIEAYINDKMISADGNVAMTGQLHLFGDPLGVNDAARKGYVDAILPVGVMLPFTGQVAPAGSWALCNGASLSTSAYPKAYAVLGFRYGGSGGSFNLPNMAGRVPIGMDTTQVEFNVTGKTGGSFTVPVPQHSHAMPHTHGIDHNHGSFASGTDSNVHSHAINPPVTTTTSSGAHAHDVSSAVRTSATSGATNSFMRADTDGTSAALTVNPTVTGGDHTHTLDIGTFTSGNSVPNHTHQVDVPSFSGASMGVSTPNTANTGASGVELQPPFVVINYILRID